MDHVTGFVPILIFFLLGVLLRRASVVDEHQAGFLLKLVFFVTLPALILVKVSAMTMQWQSLKLALLAVSVVMIIWPLAVLLSRRLSGSGSPGRGSVVLCSIMANNAFIIPFVMVWMDDEAIVHVMMFDLGLALVVSSFVYGLGFRYSESAVSIVEIVSRVLRVPPLWAIMLALAISTSGASLPGWGVTTLNEVGAMTSPLLLIALGAVFSPGRSDLGIVVPVVSLRMLGGGVLGLALGVLLGLEHKALVVGILCCSAPVGFNALTFSTLAGLDSRLTANIVSYSLVVGLLYIPLLMLVLSNDLHSVLG